MITSVSALDFEISSKPIKDKITLEDLAEFEITISNTGDFQKSFSMRTMDFPIWDVYTKPVINPITVDVDSGESETIRLFVDPLHVTNIGAFDVNVRIKEDATQDFKIIPLRVAVVSQGSLIGGYVPTVTATIDMENEITPSNNIPISVTIKNQNPLVYDELTVVVESNLINEEVVTELGAKEEKTFNIEVELDSEIEPQKDTILLSIKRGNQTITGPLTKSYNIISYNDLIENIQPVKKILRLDTIIKYTNKGNVEYEGEQRFETTFFKSMFTSTKPKGVLVTEDEIRYYTWDISLIPGETGGIIVSENYLPFIIILLLIGLVLGLYYVFRKPFTISKVAAQVISREGGIGEMKIVITLKSRGKIKLKEIEVADRIPNIADIERELTIGTLQPTKILKHEAKGSILKWNVDILDVGEERVISYRIKPILTIVGDLTLPPVTASYILKGKKYKLRSNTLTINPK